MPTVQPHLGSSFTKGQLLDDPRLYKVDKESHLGEIVTHSSCQIRIAKEIIIVIARICEGHLEMVSSWEGAYCWRCWCPGDLKTRDNDNVECPGIGHSISENLGTSCLTFWWQMHISTKNPRTSAGNSEWPCNSGQGPKIAVELWDMTDGWSACGASSLSYIHTLLPAKNENSNRKTSQQELQSYFYL